MQTAARARAIGGMSARGNVIRCPSRRVAWPSRDRSRRRSPKRRRGRRGVKMTRALDAAGRCTAFGGKKMAGAGIPAKSAIGSPCLASATCAVRLARRRGAGDGLRRDERPPAPEGRREDAWRDRDRHGSTSGAGFPSRRSRSPPLNRAARPSPRRGRGSPPAPAATRSRERDRAVGRRRSCRRSNRPP